MTCITDAHMKNWNDEAAAELGGFFHAPTIPFLAVALLSRSERVQTFGLQGLQAPFNQRDILTQQVFANSIARYRDGG